MTGAGHYAILLTTMFRAPRTPILAPILALALGACSTTRLAVDPTVILSTRGGQELGVSTDYGVVFLGHTAKAGDVDIAAWFGDGPNIESSVIEPVGGGIYTAEPDIRLPRVPLSFLEPADGAEVVVQGRDVSGSWRLKARVVRRPDVEGLLLEVPPELAGPTDQTGAGVYVYDERRELRLLGLLSGRLTLADARGATQSEYLTVVGPTSLWRLVSFRRDQNLVERMPYRDDLR